MSVQHSGLAAKKDVERVKGDWAERFRVLAELLKWRLDAEPTSTWDRIWATILGTWDEEDDR
ncbi:MAG: hypothetical protein OEV00_01860 [Acidobacteriota bacterium]|nr:hypothetical protein [Acidobacteriota bacterium]MDH3784052.1 hypothetical protein [Acidobacteriota bacterium]